MLTELREALVEQLAATDYPVGTSWPDKLASVKLPAVWIVPPQDGAYIGTPEDADFALAGHLDIRFDLLVLVPFTDSATALSKLETVVEKVITTLKPEWRIALTVDFPSTVNRDSLVMMGTLIHLNTEGKL